MGWVVCEECVGDDITHLTSLSKNLKEKTKAMETEEKIEI